MIPQLCEKICLWKIEQMKNTDWFVQESIMAIVSHVKKLPGDLVLIRAQTKSGFEYECTRAYCPNQEQIFASPWRRVSNLVSVRQSDNDQLPLLESALVFNLHRELCEQRCPGIRHDSLIHPGSPPRWAIPQGDATQCASHERFLYGGNHCPKCASLGEFDEHSSPVKVAA